MRTGYSRNICCEWDCFSLLPGLLAAVIQVSVDLLVRNRVDNFCFGVSITSNHERTVLHLWCDVFFQVPCFRFWFLGFQCSDTLQLLSTKELSMHLHAPRIKLESGRASGTKKAKSKARKPGKTHHASPIERSSFCKVS